MVWIRKAAECFRKDSLKGGPGLRHAVAFIATWALSASQRQARTQYVRRGCMKLCKQAEGLRRRRLGMRRLQQQHEEQLLVVVLVAAWLQERLRLGRLRLRRRRRLQHLRGLQQ